MPQNFAQWNVGDTILDLYKVTAELGEGGFGKVYKVRHQAWNIDLAVKIPKPEVVAKAGGVENFEREAETWVNLGLHPHTVSCYYVRRIDSSPVVFAEYVEGGSLHDWIKNCTLYAEGVTASLPRILDIAIQFAWGLHYAHEQGLIHQDVKPQNVMITPEGIVKVTDFGLVNSLSVLGFLRLPVGVSGKQKVLKIIGCAKGTELYHSPEQAARKSLTRSTDLWSWAVSVLEMFKGERTWLSGTVAAEVLEDYLETGTNDPQLPHMPMQLAQLLQRCFRENPDERPHDMLTVANELQEIYQQTIGEVYPRQQPQAGKDYADSLNNRAVSLLDLGKTSEALHLWEKALQVQPHHLQSTCNRGLVLWRSGMINDDALVRDIKSIEQYDHQDWYTKYLLSLVHLERDDCHAAIETLERIQEEGTQKQEVKAALALAKERLLHSRQLLSTFELLEVDPNDANSVDITYTDNRFKLSTSPSLELQEVATGLSLATFDGQIGSANTVFLSKDKKFALTLSYSPSALELWDLSIGSCIRSFWRHFSIINSMYLSADNRFALSGSSDATVKLWDVATGSCLHTLKGHQGEVIAVCLSADNRFALSGSCDNTLKLWDVAIGRCLHTFEGHKDFISSVYLSKDNQFILSGSYDGIIKLWELNTGRCLRTFEAHTDRVILVSMATDGRFAISSSFDKKLKLWAVNGSLSVYKAPIIVSQISASEKVLDVTEKFKRELQKAQAALDRRDYIIAAQHVREARSQKAYSHDTEALYIWSRLYLCLSLKSFRGAYENTGFVGNRGFVRSASACLSADNRFVLSHNGDIRLYRPEIPGTMKLWEINTGRCLQTFEVHTSEQEFKNHKKIPGVIYIPQDRSYITAICLSVNNQFALSGSRLDQSSSERKNVLMLWEVATGKCLRIFEGYTSRITSICLSANNQFALIGSIDPTLKLLEVATGRPMLNFQGHALGVKSVCLSADNQFALSCSYDKTLKLWEVATGQCLQTFEGHTEAINSVCLSANNRFALSGSDDGTMKLWELATGQCLQTFEGHTEAINSVCLSANNRFALSGSDDGTMKLWELATGQCLQTFQTDANYIISVCLSTDSRFALCASEKGLKLWLLDWELENQPTADWDEGARQQLEKMMESQSMTS
jgi:WD40 repeat protein/serine/threonine protein kinase